MAHSSPGSWQDECVNSHLGAQSRFPPSSGTKTIKSIFCCEHRFTADYNRLREIPYGLPTSLKFLCLKSNRISAISARTGDEFVHMTLLKSIDLSENRIVTIEAWNLRGIPNIEYLFLFDNPFVSLRSLRLCFSLTRNKIFRVQPSNFRYSSPSIAIVSSISLSTGPNGGSRIC